MTVVLFLPDGKTQQYPNASALLSKNGLTTFDYQPDAGNKKTKSVTTTLPILVEEDAGEPGVKIL